MIRYQSQHQLPIEEFRTPFELKLSRENRWVKLAEALPWDRLVNIYCRTLSQKHGRPTVDPRIVIGALIIKHKEGLSDENTIQAIQENIYHQYFLGLHQYQYAPVFDPSLFVTIRKRIGVDAFDAMVLELMRIATELPLASSAHSDDTPPSSSSTAADGAEQNVASHATPSPSVPAPSSSASSDTRLNELSCQPNAGTLIVDMTVAPADIAYPTDMELLNAAREHTEALIDTLYTASPDTVKPRTYRRNARKAYLAFAKQRKRSLKTLRKALRKQLGYVGRNIKTIHTLLDTSTERLSFTTTRTFWIVQELHRQQQEMYDAKTHRISDRIVSLAQPHVRPIVRGKAKASTEFGAQVSVSLMNGYSRVHRVAWDPYNEGSDLREQVERYRATYGCYPAIILADKKYGTKDNRSLMKHHGIRYGGTPLGRPRKDGVKDSLLPKAIVNQRNHIEGTFGRGKRSYGLDRISARRIDTSASWIATIFFVMNLPLFLKSLGTTFLSFLVSTLHWCCERWMRFTLGRKSSILCVP